MFEHKISHSQNKVVAMMDVAILLIEVNHSIWRPSNVSA